MKKGLSNQNLSSGADFSLPRAKILRGRKNFKRLFEKDAHVFRKKYVGLRFQIVDDSSFGCLMAFIVKKSLGKANKRNRMKRLLREAYRLHQYTISDTLKAYQITFHGALMAHAVDVDYEKIEQDVVSLLDQVRQNIPSHLSGNS